MEHEQFRDKMHGIVASIAEAGYDPYVQLTGYLQTGNSAFITRRNGAREQIRQMDAAQIKQYLDDCLRHSNTENERNNSVAECVISVNTIVLDIGD